MELARSLAQVRLPGRGLFVSRVLEHGEERVLLGPPTSELGDADPAAGDPIDVGLVTAGGVVWRAGVVTAVESEPGAQVHVRLVGPSVRNDRRAAFRAPDAVPVEIAPFGGDPVEGRLVDVSTGGLRVEAPLSFRPGDTVQLAVLVPGEAPLRMTAEVVHAEETATAGFRFQLATAAARQRLVRRALDRLAAR